MTYNILYIRKNFEKKSKIHIISSKYASMRLLFSHIRYINRIVQSKVHRSVTNNFSNSEAPRTSSWCILWVESNTAVSNWFRMCWCERWDFTSNTEHVIEIRRLLFSHIRCINRIVQSKVASKHTGTTGYKYKYSY